MKTETVRTERLLLRRLRQEDAPFLHKNCSSDPGTVRFLLRGVIKDAAETEKLVGQWIERYAEDGFLLWGIEAEGEVIGTINLHDLSEDGGSGEIGFSIGSRWWKRGLMTEAVGAVIRHAFDQLSMNCITGWCAEENVASARVMEKSGMRRAGKTENSLVLSDGTLTGLLWYEIRKESGR